MEKLIDDRPLGIYSDQDGFFRSEYQVGRRLIWVRCQHRQDCLECVDRADKLMPDICKAIPDAIELAENCSRIMIPEFWARHDISRREGNRLDVWGITITPGLGVARFDISRNYGFDYASLTFSKEDYWNDEPFFLPELPEKHHVYIIRDRHGLLSVEPTRAW
ncbi:hypothetical protein DyAD56_07930 [Dyella sp. AD56]|uniref:hypothetical protein n=1 Tax=Dyella sp. AD56 TaxID=1528744 RepID=UPI000C8559EA|nr:hypothetical protein [Dyella sp. AD56]PMQ05709.1 hypothetical protein DyAD56_07930 [Dyella sp. AD56]